MAAISAAAARAAPRLARRAAPRTFASDAYLGGDLETSTLPNGVVVATTAPGAPLTIPVPPWPVDREGRPLARIKKKPTHPCGVCIGPGDAGCCQGCGQFCFFIFCCPFAMLAACNGSL